MPGRLGRTNPSSTRNLGGIWDFAFLGDVDADTLDVEAIGFDDRMPVPGCFDATPKYAGRRGLAACRTHFGTAEGLCRFVLDGAHHWCRVYVNGRAIGEHAGGFTRFGMDFEVKPDSGPSEIVVLVDNRFDNRRSPLHLDYYDWYHYGGITRGAWLRTLGKEWIDAVRIVTEDFADRRIAVSIDYGCSGEGSRVLSIEVDDEPVVNEEAVDLDAGGGRIERTVELPGAALWSPDSPSLHTMRVRLGGDEETSERFGIRQVRVEGRRILINDRPVRLLGFNRHESHPDFGHALPDQLLVTDVQLLKGMNCNFVRGSHYPQDGRFLDLCDEAGICVWSEAHGWGNTSEHLTDENFLAAQRENIREMVSAACNHPSVIMWGILNEAHTEDSACRPAFEELLGLLRELDPTRPVTFACNHWNDDVCMDLVDVVSVNDYPGWYHMSIETIPEELERIVARIDSQGLGDKPLIISEIGAGAVPGWRDVNRDRWSEQYQAKLLDKVIRSMFLDSDRFCGLAIWQFCDIRTGEMTRRMLGRPRGFNNKGVVDEYRRPKLARDVVKELFGGLHRTR